jgi:hypothetical protein
MVAANTRGHAAVASLGARGDQRAMASRLAVFHTARAFLSAPSESHHGIAYVQEVHTTSHQGDAALEELFQTHLNVIQGHDAYDAVLLSAIAFIGNVGD